jgi:hypothetical protein
MSSLLIFSRPSNTTLKDRQATGQPERGDVVDMRDDDPFFWGTAIRAIGWWQEVVVPGARMRNLGGLLKSSADDVPIGSIGWRHRVWTVDLDALGVGQVAGGVWVVKLDDFVRHCALKDASLRSAEIGAPRWVIG